MNVNVLFSMVGPPLTDAQMERIQAIGVSGWHVINERRLRLLVSAIGESTAMQAVMRRLDQFNREPRIIGVWRRNGSAIGAYPFNLQRYLQVAPDDIDPITQQPVRPTQWRETHRWQGWAPKQIA